MVLLVFGASKGIVVTRERGLEHLIILVDVVVMFHAQMAVGVATDIELDGGDDMLTNVIGSRVILSGPFRHAIICLHQELVIVLFTHVSMLSVFVVLPHMVLRVVPVITLSRR